MPSRCCRLPLTLGEEMVAGPASPPSLRHDPLPAGSLLNIICCVWRTGRAFLQNQPTPPSTAEPPTIPSSTVSSLPPQDVLENTKNLEAQFPTTERRVFTRTPCRMTDCLLCHAVGVLDPKPATSCAPFSVAGRIPQSLHFASTHVYILYLAYLLAFGCNFASIH